MSKFLTFLFLLMALAPSNVNAQQIRLRLHYAIPGIWTQVQEKLALKFTEMNPGIFVDFDTPAASYSDGVKRLLRQAQAGRLPDVAFVGLNRWRLLQKNNLIQPLDTLYESAADFEKTGHSKALRSLGQYQGRQFAIATSASTMVIYVNPDLLTRAGGSLQKFPTNFDDLIKLASKINALGDEINGIWLSPHDWRFQSILGSYGGRPMSFDEKSVLLDRDEGIMAAKLYARLAKEAGMLNFSGATARNAFVNGKLGVYIDSSSFLIGIENRINKRFKVAMEPLPISTKDKQKVYFPTGGSAVVLFKRNGPKFEAAREFIRFLSGPDAAKIIVENSGYAPTNTLVLSDDSFLGEFYKRHGNVKAAHDQVAKFAGPWYSYPSNQGIDIAELVEAEVSKIVDGADPESTIKGLAAKIRANSSLN